MITLQMKNIKFNSGFGQLKDNLIAMFNLPSLLPEKWERIRDEFMERIDRNCGKLIL